MVFIRYSGHEPKYLDIYREKYNNEKNQLVHHLGKEENTYGKERH